MSVERPSVSVSELQRRESGSFDWSVCQRVSFGIEVSWEKEDKRQSSLGIGRLELGTCLDLVKNSAERG